jgi:ABC-2 type transport system permease protein
MKKTLVILAREYRTRLRRPAFWVLTLLVPLLLAALYAIPVIAASGTSQHATVLVVDETGLFQHALYATDEVNFQSQSDLDLARQRMTQDDSVAAILFIPARQNSEVPRDAFLYHRDKTPPQAVVNAATSQLQLILRRVILADVYAQLDPGQRHSVENTGIRIHTLDADTGRPSFATVKAVAATVLATLMVLALLVFGIQVMRSVQEEKASRVAEVVASSVKPVQLLTGKVAGIALAAITQLALWILLTAAAIGIIQKANPELFAQARQQQETALGVATKGAEATAQYHNPVQLVDETVQGLTAINLPLVASLFILFFLLGYLLYGTLLAALAARLDSDADALQWVLLTLSPLLVTLLLIPLLLDAPGGPLATTLSCIPFTAPAAVLLRLPFGIAIGTVVLAAALMLLCSVAAAILADRTYRRHLVR